MKDALEKTYLLTLNNTIIDDKLQLKDDVGLYFDFCSNRASQRCLRIESQDTYVKFGNEDQIYFVNHILSEDLSRLNDRISTGIGVSRRSE